MSDNVKPYVLVAATFGIVLVLCWLWAMFNRQAVKRGLLERGCQPIHIWWVPLAYWATALWVRWWTAVPFRVIYKDAEGRLHKAYCCVYQELMGSPFGPRRIEWIKDELRDFIDV